MKQVMLGERMIHMPTDDSGDSFVDLALIQGSRSQKDPFGKGFLEIIKGSSASSKDSLNRNFQALFTNQETDFTIHIKNNSDLRVK